MYKQIEDSLISSVDIVLELSKKHSIAHISQLAIEQFRPFECNEYIIDICRNILTWKPDKPTIKVPISWWDMVKERFFTARMKKWWPCAYFEWKAEAFFLDAEVKLNHPVFADRFGKPSFSFTAYVQDEEEDD